MQAGVCQEVQEIYTIIHNQEDPREGGEKQTFDGFPDNRSGIFLGLLG